MVELDGSSVVRLEIRAAGFALVTFLAVLLLTVFLVRWLSRSLVVLPILQLNSAAKQLETGNWKVIKEYGQLPLVECFAGQLNQVFMNILANAIDALEESNIGHSFEDIKVNPNCITIVTQVSDDK